MENKRYMKNKNLTNKNRNFQHFIPKNLTYPSQFKYF